jgi:uncharacterized protein YndB with AHSA1/START domain
MSRVAPVRKTVTVEASPERAFRVFTQGIDRWWPRQHHIGQSPLKRAVLEPRLGGRWYSVCEDGSECEVGKVLSWEPPERLVLAWQITAHWQYDPSFVTEVEVLFIAEGPRRTRVELEHRDLDRFGAAAVELRERIGAASGWGLILESFARAAADDDGAAPLA